MTVLWFKTSLVYFFNGDGTFHPCQPLRSLMGSTACLYRGPNMKSSSVFSSKCTFPGYFLENVPNDSGKTSNTSSSPYRSEWWLVLCVCWVFLGVSSFWILLLTSWDVGSTMSQLGLAQCACVWDEHKNYELVESVFLSPAVILLSLIPPPAV